MRGKIWKKKLINVMKLLKDTGFIEMTSSDLSAAVVDGNTNERKKKDEKLESRSRRAICAQSGVSNEAYGRSVKREKEIFYSNYCS